MSNLSARFETLTRTAHVRFGQWDQNPECNRARFNSDLVTFTRLWFSLYRELSATKFAKMLNEYEDFVNELPELNESQ